MIKLETKSMTNAIAKAKVARPKVRVINADERTYNVTGSAGISSNRNLPERIEEDFRSAPFRALRRQRPAGLIVITERIAAHIFRFRIEVRWRFAGSLCSTKEFYSRLC